MFDKTGEGGCDALAWYMEDLPVISDNGVSTRICHSSTGMINYREANITMRKASGKRYSSEG